MWNDFKTFAFKGNVLDLAVAVVLGTAFTAVVTAIVTGLIMPVVGEILPGGDWRAWTVWKFQLGGVLAALLNFLIVAFVLFILVSKVIKALDRRPPAVIAATISDEAKLLKEIRDLLAAGAATREPPR
ncbi:MAG: large conductance mechanosensitive channel protein MscL [Deltaproteobacteria bacterium]|nr:large conductance mechanosensitive channel protein MscL [Deltaproteobacteria bacterium]MDQ3295971.1 large conductance mechanosensitive channel protein MscL [Myxococcota bacterium]